VSRRPPRYLYPYGQKAAARDPDHNEKAGDRRHTRAYLVDLLQRAGYDVSYFAIRQSDLAEALGHPAEIIVSAGGDGMGSGQRASRACAASAGPLAGIDGSVSASDYWPFARAATETARSAGAVACRHLILIASLSGSGTAMLYIALHFHAVAVRRALIGRRPDGVAERGASRWPDRLSGWILPPPRGSTSCWRRRAGAGVRDG
jgi:hypothetical protein